MIFSTGIVCLNIIVSLRQAVVSATHAHSLMHWLPVLQTGVFQAPLCCWTRLEHKPGTTLVKCWGLGYRYGSTWGLCLDLECCFFFFLFSSTLRAHIDFWVLSATCLSLCPSALSQSPTSFLKKTFITTLYHTSLLAIELPQKSMILLPQALSRMDNNRISKDSHFLYIAPKDKYLQYLYVIWCSYQWLCSHFQCNCRCLINYLQWSWKERTWYCRGVKVMTAVVTFS